MNDLVDDLLAGIITGSQLDAKAFPPLRWAVPGLIPEGFGLFTGPPKVGKSWCVLDIALAVASGTEALGKVRTGHARPVLYLALEDGERRLQGRCHHLLGEGQPIPDMLHMLVQAPQQGAIPVIRAWLDQHGQSDPLVILDTLGRVMLRALPGEGAYERDYRMGSALKLLVDDHPGSTLLVVHHVRKATSADWMDSTSGTNGLNGAADFTVNLSRDRNDDSGVLKVTGRDVPENEYAITNRNGRWEIDGTDLTNAASKIVERSAAAGLGDRSTEIVQWVNDQPEPVSPKDVAEALGIPHDATKVYLTRLFDGGRLARPSRGKYMGVTSVTSVTSEPSALPVFESEVTQVTQVTPSSRCSICNTPMTDVGDGATTHANCQEPA